MKKKIISYITMLIFTCVLSINAVVNAISVTLPRQWAEGWDYYPGQNVQKDGTHSLLDIIRFVNDYLWFAIWFVCFLFVVINWIKLIISRWDEQETKKAMHALIWCVIWIIVCLSAYIIVNVAIRLFA